MFLKNLSIERDIPETPTENFNKQASMRSPFLEVQWHNLNVTVMSKYSVRVFNKPFFSFHRSSNTTETVQVSH